MHDIIQETAWEIVRQESVEEPGSRSRLSDPEDIYHVLKDDKVTNFHRRIDYFCFVLLEMLRILIDV